MKSANQGRAAQHATILEFVDALLLFDEPMLNSRYHGMLFRMSDNEARQKLARLPGLVLDSARFGRLGAFEWLQAGIQPLSPEFIERAERVLLHSFLTLTEEQLRLVAFMARAAPARSSRQYFDEMARSHHEIAHALREVLRSTGGLDAMTKTNVGLRSVQEEQAEGDLRGQVERAIRATQAAGRAPRNIILSATGQRHLRDQGLFQHGDTTLLGIPVSVDFGWDEPAFVVQTYDVVPLDEIFSATAADGEG